MIESLKNLLLDCLTENAENPIPIINAKFELICAIWYLNLYAERTLKILETMEPQKTVFENEHFFCSLSGQNEVQKVKGRLMVLTGENLLLALEERYPEVLQIDEPAVCSDIARYKYFLQHKSGTDSAYLAAVRLTLPILMQKMKVMVEQIAIKPKNRKIILMLKEAMGKVRLDAFYGLRSLKSMPQSFCIVQKFVKYSQKALELHKSAKGIVKIEAIANWKAEKCECEEEQRRVFQDQFQESSVKHFAMLSIYFTDNAYKIVEFVQNTRGARTRVKKLMKASNLNLNFMHIFLKQLRNSICFYKQESNFVDAIFGEDKATRVAGKLSVFIAVWVCWLDDELSEQNANRTDDVLWQESNFVDAIFGEDKATRVAGKLSVFIAVWVCWLDDELSEQNANRTVGLKKLDEIVWRQKREDIEDIYDEIVDDTLDELALRSQRLKDLFLRIFQFVQAKRGERRLNRLGIGHRKGSPQQMDNQLQMIDEQTTEFDQWNRVMQFKELSELLNGEEFRTKIKNDFILDSTLRSNYREFMSNPSEAKRCQLDIGIYSNNEATLLETGSYVLGTHSQRSDIDTICIVPQKLGHREEKERFYGIYLCNLDIEADQRLCEDNSLYCQFCKIDFDISFAAIPDVDWFPKEPLGADEVELMMKFLAKQKSPQEAMLKALSALSQIIILKNGPILSSNKNEWKKLFPAKQFIEKYRHFVVIACIVSVKQHILQFCGFVERKLRVQLLHFDQIMDSLVDYSHIKSDQQFGGNDQCPTKIRENNPRFRNPLCKIWLVGVKMNNAPLGNNQKSSKNIKLEEYFDEILNKEIDMKIFAEYDAKVLKGWYQHIKLESKYEQMEELKQQEEKLWGQIEKETDQKQKDALNTELNDVQGKLNNIYGQMKKSK
uniref:VWFA domain-containing protein n=1 Tax=Globodera pallida TaxID=36090 RepID=A0A183C9T3_GLOPA